MNSLKIYLTSKTIWGLVISGAASVLAKSGIIHLSAEDQAQTVNFVLSAIQYGSLIFAAYGRRVANGPLK